MIKYLMYFFILLSSYMSCIDLGPYYADDIEIFKDTPVWNLAKAIDRHDLEKLEVLLKQDQELVNYREPKFGITLLYWVLHNSPRYWDEYFYDEAKMLIAYGADPYISNMDNVFPLLKAADIHLGSARFVKLCIDSHYTRNLPDSIRKVLLNEALIVSCGKLWEEVDAVKLFVDAGADVNYFNSDSTECPVSQSFTYENMLMARYLIIEKKANYNISIRSEINRKNIIPVIKILYNNDFSDKPEKQKIKEEILNYIKR